MTDALEMGGVARSALLALAALALALNAATAFNLPRTAQSLTLYRIWDDAAVCNDGTPCACRAARAATALPRRCAASAHEAQP